MEPFAPPPEKRLDAVKKLNEEGVQAGVNFTPIVPFLLDDVENIEEVIRKASQYAKYVLIGAAMTLRSNQRIRFLGLLKKEFPELVEKYENLYKEQMIAFFKEFKTGNPYSAWAYHKASQNIENLNESIREVYKRNKFMVTNSFLIR